MFKMNIIMHLLLYVQFSRNVLMLFCFCRLMKMLDIVIYRISVTGTKPSLQPSVSVLSCLPLFCTIL